MGVIELQVFVSLVVILGAAFVALICDFLKGNNEQLRESNIVLRVREDERTRREELVERVQERVQRQTLEVLTQVQRVSGQRPVVAAKPAAAKSSTEQPVAQAVPAPPSPAAVASDPGESIGRGYAERSGRVRRQRPTPAAPEVSVPIPVRTDADATWAQDIILRRHPQAEVKPEPELQREALPEPKPEPARTVPAVQFEAFDIRQAATPRAVAAQPAVEPMESPAPAMASAQKPIPMEPLAGHIQAAAMALTPQPPQLSPALPVSDARPELSIEIVPDSALILQPEPLIESAADHAEPEAPMLLEAPAPAMASATELPLSAVAQSPGDPIWSGSPVLHEAAASVPSAGSQVVAQLTPHMAHTAECTQSPVVMPALRAAIAQNQLAPAEVQSVVPTLQLQAEAALFEVSERVSETLVASSETPTAEDPSRSEEVEESQVVRVRVLRDDEDLDSQEILLRDEEAVAGFLQAAAAETHPEFEPAGPVQMAAAEAILAETAPAFDAGNAIEDPFPSLDEILTPATLELEPWLNEPTPETVEPVESRSNVVQMPASSLRPQESEKTMVGELAIPGGFHEASSLARLMEDERPFHGLVLAISVVDHVRLLADQGKPATEQLMASVTRLVVSMAREQDFVCRIGEDECILIFGRETGAAAKRRIQLVSERLWDFQLRSLGSVSVIFSWGAAESQAQPLMQAVENAREQMMDTRRNRRAYNTGANRFNRRAAN